MICDDDGQEQTVTDLVTLQKDCQRIAPLGLTLKEAKQPLTTIQKHLLQHQVDAFLDARSTCPDCGALHTVKGYQTRSFRTRFGTCKLRSLRLFHCRCRRRKTTSFRPLTALLPESVAPEFLLMETQWASLVSYGLTVDALTDFLPLDVTLDVKTVRHDTLKVAERCEAELGEEQWSCIEGCPRDWGTLPIPDGPITVGIDGGYVRDWEAKQHHCEVIVGKSTLAFRRDEADDIPSSKRFGFVQTLDVKPKRRLFAVLQSQGMQPNQQITFLSDGSDTVRDLLAELLHQAPPCLRLGQGLTRASQRERLRGGGVGEPCQEATTEEPTQDLDRQEEALGAWGPRGPVWGGPTAWHDTVDVRMVWQLLAPSVEDR